jgi:tetraacyldisaccharide 4'-kinase
MPNNLKPLGDSLPVRLGARLYGAAVGLRNRWYDTDPRRSRQASRPVISIGGVHAGGTGKTPLTLLVSRYLQKSGFTVALLSRGYGRQSKAPLLVSPDATLAACSWEQIGDEPAMLRMGLPGVWLGIGADRVSSARALDARLPGRSVFILDDGFQHRRLARDLDIVCLPAQPFDARLIPAGYLREPLSSLGRARLLCLIGGPAEEELMRSNQTRLRAMFPAAQVFVLYQQPAGWTHLQTGQSLPVPPLKKPALISGIARPQRFVSMVEQAGLKPAVSRTFGDHHVFRPEEIEPLCSPPVDGIITTAKDACRLNTLILVMRPAIWYLNMELHFAKRDEEISFFSALINHLSTL